MTASDVAILAVVIFLWGTLSARLERYDVTAPIIFVLAGLLLTHAPLTPLSYAPSPELVKALAEITLVLVLFSDASRVRLRDLRAETGLCLRLLGVGLPLTIGLGPAGARVVQRPGYLPPTLAGRLEYDPPLPSWRDQLTQRMPAGSVIKTYAIYPEPFWRQDGLNGQAVSDTGPVKVTFDNSPPSGTPGVLMGFLEGKQARIWARHSPAERREAVLGCFVRYFGQAAARPAQYLERDWMAEEFTRGCYGAHFAPGVWTSYGEAWHAPIGRIHWAGTECAPQWNGYMEGAVRSGEAAADAVGAH